MVSNPWGLLAHIDCDGSSLGAIAVNYADRCDELATLLGVEPVELKALFYRQKDRRSGTANEIDYFGVVMPLTCREWQRRRISSSSLRASPFHRAAWELRFLTWCPESYQHLTDVCPSCNSRLTWLSFKGIYRCDHCSFDLRDFDTKYISDQDRPAATFVSQLVSHSSDERGCARKQLHKELLELKEIDLLRLALMLASSFRWSWSQTRVALSESELTAGVSPALWSQGVERLLAWPASVDLLIDEARRSAPCNTYEKLKELGPIGHCLRTSKGDLSKLLKARIEKHYRGLGIELSNRFSRCSRWYEAGWKEIADVETAVGVSSAAIYRAVRICGAEQIVDGNGAHARTLVREYDVRRWADGVKRAASIVTARQALGVPEFAIWELVASGHLRVLEPIVREMCGRMGPLDLASITTLCETLRAKCKEGRPMSSDLVPLHQVVMTAKTAVPRWAEALEMICQGALAAFWDDAGRATFVRRILVEHQAADILEKAERWVSKTREPMPRFIDHEAAADLLREKRYKILELVASGAINCEEGGIGKRIIRQSLYDYAEARFEQSNERQ